MSPNDFIDNEEKISRIILALSTTIKEIEPKIADKLNELLIERLSVKGKIIIDKTTYSDLEQIYQEVHKVFLKSEVPKRLKGIIDELDNQYHISASLTEASSGFKVKNLDIAEEKKLFIQNLSDNVLGYDSFKIRKIAEYNDVVFSGILNNATITELKNSIIDLSKTNVNKGSLLTRYAEQVSTDTINQYRGFVQKKISDNGRFNAWGYFGSLVKNSRTQCIRWVKEFNGVIPFDQIKSEVKWANKNGTGYGKQTLTVKNFPLIRGGHNCRHTVIATIKNDRAEKYLKLIQSKSDEFAKDTNLK